MSEVNHIESLVRQMVVALADYPDEVQLETVDEAGMLTINIRLNAEDVGKIIGRQGRIIKSLRTIARAASSYMGGKHVEVEVLD